MFDSRPFVSTRTQKIDKIVSQLKILI